MSYSYGRRVALRRFSATMGVGLTGVLGPNGAGKSTLMSILATLRRPQEGRTTINGVPLSEWEKVRRSLGYLPQRFDLMGTATVRENLEYAAWARGIAPSECPPAAEAAASRSGLGKHLGAKVRSLSGGYRQRVGLGCAIVHRPAVLLLDEPTVGIDPVQRVDLRALISEIAQDAAVVVATHLVEDVSLAGSQVIVIDEGTARFDGPVAELERIGSERQQPGMSPMESGYYAVVSA